MHISRVLKHYKNQEILEKMIKGAKDREVSIRFGERGFGKRPDVLTFPGDIIDAVQNGATSFHYSEELWKNPLSLNTGLKRRELDELRKGWDLVLDIDCAVFEYSRIAAELTYEVLIQHGVKSTSVKFSGNKGFHLGIPFKAFPEVINNQETRLLFPEAPRRIAEYIKEQITGRLGQQILDFEQRDINKIIQKTGKSFEEITHKSKDQRTIQLDPSSFLEIDTILLASRHMIRMPYSLHEKSGLVSTPFNPAKISKFRREFADPERFRSSEFDFLDDKNCEKGEAISLLIEALDYTAKIEHAEEKENSNYINYIDQSIGSGEIISKEFFPPCIQGILAGLRDGRKRSVFVLLNFLTTIGWQEPEVAEMILNWNKQNPESLREQYIMGQIRYHFASKKKIPPPNCSSENYYINIGMCKPDAFCRKIKNPASYSKLKYRISKEDAKAKQKRKHKKTGKKQKKAKESIKGVSKGTQKNIELRNSDN